MKWKYSASKRARAGTLTVAGRSPKGFKVPLSIATHNELLVAPAGHGIWHESALGEELFVACTQTGVATTVGLGTTATGFILTNPGGSGKLLVVHKVIGAVTTDPGGNAPVGLAVTFYHPTEVIHTTPLAIRDAMVGDGHNHSVAYADSAATLPTTPVFIRPLTGSTSLKTDVGTVEDIDGAIILKPGTSLSTFSLTTAFTALWFMMWTETTAEE